MPKGTHGQQDEPEKPDDSGSLPDLSEMTTAYLVPPGVQRDARKQAIALHEAAARELEDLIRAVIKALAHVQVRIVTDQLSDALRAALEHNLKDLESYRAELRAQVDAHMQALEHLWREEDAQKDLPEHE
jgi:hypothetical protein